jgi:hypothetical protein
MTAHPAQENETLRRELAETVDALLELRAETSGGRDEVVTFVVKVPAQAGWHRWKKDAGYRTEEDARVAAAEAAKYHSRARIVERRSLIRERVIDTIAIATEAGTAETENTGSVHEGADPKGIAQGSRP